jgi:hypothetical protein
MRALIGSVSALGIGVLAALSGSVASAATGPVMPWSQLGQLRSPAAGPAAQAAAWPHRSGTGIKPTPMLDAVSTVSPHDAWAVGCYTKGEVGQCLGGSRGLVLHWDGTAWSKVSSPNPGGIYGGGLAGVSAVSATDAWAVGNYFHHVAGGTGGFDSLILHWDGTRWMQVPSPNPGGTNGTGLYGVSVISETDAWAVGAYNDRLGDCFSFVLHWDGTRWARVPSPNPGGTMGCTALNGVSAVSETDAWAVGYYGNTAGQHSLVLHWNGTRWAQVPSPSPYPGSPLAAISAVSATDVWAAGSTFHYTGGVSDTLSLLLHWNGTRWTQVPSPNPGGNPGYTSFAGVSAVSATDAWATGVYTPPGFNRSLSLLLHWNGTRWTQVPSPSPNNYAPIPGVSAVSATDAWAVGYTVGLKTVILRWNGTRWARVPSPN